MEDYKIIEECRSCGNDELISYLDLGEMPLVNSVLTKQDIKNEKTYPLEVLLCPDCNLSQLSVVIDPSTLFRDYNYRSSISNSFKDHCENFSQDLNKNLLNKGDLIVDIASNDGCLLRPFKTKGNVVLGVDPAVNLAKIANESGIETIPEFWNQDLAKTILEKYGPAKAITAFNVFAHVDDMHSFLEGANTLLAEEGYLIIEAPHLYNLIENNQFDTVYHEHLSYLLAKPIERMTRQHDLRLARIEKKIFTGVPLDILLKEKIEILQMDLLKKLWRKKKKLGYIIMVLILGLKDNLKG